MLRENEKNFALQDGKPIENVVHCFCRTIIMKQIGVSRDNNYDLKGRDDRINLSVH